MIFIKNELITSLTIALIVTLLVLLHTPKYVKHPKDKMSENHYKRIVIGVRAFIVSFVVMLVLVYLFSNEGSSMLKHIRKGEPDF